MKKVQTVFHTTPAEKELIKQLAGNNVSAYLRGLVRADAQRKGVPLPDALLEDTRPTHGKHQWVQCKQCGGWNVGEVDGVRVCADCGWDEPNNLNIRQNYQGVLSGIVCRTKDYNLPTTVTENDLRFCSEYWGHRCLACGENPISNNVRGLVFDHWIPLGHKDCPGSTPGNIVLLCTKCNKKKNNSLPHEWLEKYHPDRASTILRMVDAYFNEVS